MMESPLVSIIIPSFNRAYILGETLESVIAQTYKNWECIVVDDGSYDFTEELMEFYCKKNENIFFHKRPELKVKGASSCRNYGIELSKGNLFQFLDSDDLLKINKLEEQVKLYSNDSTLFTCKWGGFVETKELKNRFKYKYHSYRNFKKGRNLLKTFGKKDEFFPPHVYLTPRSLIEKAGYWNEELTNNDDAEFFTRIILAAKGIKFTQQTAVYYRYSGTDKLSSFTDGERVRSAIKSWKLIEEHILFNYPDASLVYVQNAKRFLKESIQKKYPQIIKDERLFFSVKRPVSIYFKTKQKVSALFKKTSPIKNPNDLENEN